MRPAIADDIIKADGMIHVIAAGLRSGGRRTVLTYVFERLPQNPIIRAGQHPAVGDNVNGPSLIRVPDWVPHRLGRYYLYFSAHAGTSIRLAVADDIAGPWRVLEAGAFGLEQSGFDRSIASPDAVVIDEFHEIRLYFQGCFNPGRTRQFTRVATSPNGIDFHVRPEILGPPYWRVFRYGGFWYSLAMPGRMFRSRDGLSNFESGPDLLDFNTRHSAVILNGSELLVFYSKWGTCPERIQMRSVELGGDWRSWTASLESEVLRPEHEWEGLGRPLRPSRKGAADGPERQLRDPCVYREGADLFLSYACAGESGIGIARAREASK
jgi:hypothetical protein